jgi:4-hydroxybenzoate polyprenyltransferase
LKPKLFFTWKGLLLWSNHFYGIAAGLMSIEMVLTIFNKPPSIFLVVCIYLSTIVYYTYAYFDEIETGIYNERSQWYLQNKGYLKIRQVVLILLCLYLAFFKLPLIDVFYSTTTSIKIILLLTLIISFFYARGHVILKNIQIRNKGFLKCLSIAWVWVVVGGIAPLVMASGGQVEWNPFSNYIFMQLLQLFVFILILAILFDIKDLNRDQDEKVKTLVAKYGIKPTIYKFILPLVLLYIWVSLFLFFRLEQPLVYLIFPFLIAFLLILVTYLVQKRTAIHENILLIDGLIIAKALIGIVLFWAGSSS